jgi:N-acetylglucosaminyl-diphospho-decaprenol L-rhamnosyltransferase
MPDQRAPVRLAVVTHNSARVLPGLLDSLPAACDGVAWELVITDNASHDGSLDLVSSRLPGARGVPMGRNAGYAAGINTAAGMPGDWRALVVLNPDVRLAPGSVAKLLAALDVPGTGIAVPRLAGEDGKVAPSLRRRPTALRALGEALLGGTRAGRVPALGELIVDPAAYERPGHADWASGAAMCISRACMEATGPWDESFLLYSEETDFCLRARDAGFALRYEPAARGVHIGGEAHISPMLWSLLTTNRVRLHARRHGRARAALYWAVVTFGEALRALAGRRASRAALAALLLPGRRVRSLPAEPPPPRPAPEALADPARRAPATAGAGAIRDVPGAYDARGRDGEAVGGEEGA